MNISVVRTFTPKNAGTENSETLKIKTSTKEAIIAGFIKGKVILKITVLIFVITNAVSSNCELIFDNALPTINIDKGVKIVVNTRITLI